MDYIYEEPATDDNYMTTDDYMVESEEPIVTYDGDDYVITYE